MFQNWLPYIIIAGLSSNLFNVFLRNTLRSHRDPTAYAWWFELIRLGFFSLLIPFFPQFANSWLHILILVSLGLIELIAVYFYMKMHSANELSFSTILMQLRSVYVPIFAFFALGERLTSTQWLGIALVVAGSIIVIRPRTLKLDRALSYALIAGVMTAISSVIIKIATGFASIPIITAAFSLPSVLLLPLMMRNGWNRIKEAKNIVLKHNLPASVMNIVSMYALVAALQFGRASQMAGVFQGVAMLSVVAGIVFLKEVERKNEKLLAGAVTIAGIFLLI